MIDWTRPWKQIYGPPPGPTAGRAMMKLPIARKMYRDARCRPENLYTFWKKVSYQTSTLRFVLELKRTTEIHASGGRGELLWTGVRIGWDWSGGWEGLHWLQSSNTFFSQIMTPFSIPFGPVCCLELIQKMRSHKYIFYYLSYLKK